MGYLICPLLKKNRTKTKVKENLDRYIDMSMDICHDVCGLTGPNRENAGVSRYLGKFQGTAIPLGRRQL